MPYILAWDVYLLSPYDILLSVCKIKTFSNNMKDSIFRCKTGSDSGIQENIWHSDKQAIYYGDNLNTFIMSVVYK